MLRALEERVSKHEASPFETTACALASG